MRTFAKIMIILYALATIRMIADPEGVAAKRNENPKESILSGIIENIMMGSFLVVFLKRSK